jgi:anti-sigma regulatory factor (Ser/Thr protein kinase)
MQFNGEASGPGNGFIHQALIYGSDEEFMDVAVPFIEGGLRSKQPTMVTVQGRHVDNLRAALGGTPAGVTFRPVEDWYETSARTREKFARWVAEETDAGHSQFQVNGRRVRVISEPPWAVGREAQIRDWARHESVINVAFAGQPVTFLCPFDARVLPQEVIGHACATHPEIVDADGISASGSYEDPLVFCRRLDSAVKPHHGRPAMEVGFGLEDLPMVRRLIGSFATDAGLPESRADELVLAVNEIATNAVIHGRSPTTVRIWDADDEVVVEVADAGDGIRDVLAGQLTPPTAGLGGRGLWLTRLLCDAVELRNGTGCTVTMHAVHAATPSIGAPR